MTRQEKSQDLELMKPSHLTIEYSRLGIGVKPNLGLTSPVAVNALTGIMHAIHVDNGEIGLLCLSDVSKLKGYHTEECEARFRSSAEVQGIAIVKSLSALSLRACRKCEKAMQERAKQ